jgi:acyl-CoA synthetase (AMP-forming)/AMP-acid ligase II
MSNSGIKNITDYLFDFANSNPDKPALLYPNRITFSELCKTINNYANGFLKNGISKGSKTIVLITPGVELFAATFALLRIGAVPVMIDPGMGNKNMSVALSKARADAFVGMPKAMFLKYIFPQYFKTVKVWISTYRCWFWQGVSLKHFMRFQDKEYSSCKVEPNDTAAVFFTSGSTGPAKGVIYRSSMIDAQIQCLKNHFKYSPYEIDLCTFPLIGLLIMCLGLSVVLSDMDMTHPAKLNPEKLVQNFSQFGCTHLFCSPMVLQKLAKFGNENHIQLSTLKRVMTAGAPVSTDLLREFSKLLPESSEIHTPYGATEALPVTDIGHRELLELDKKYENHFQGICVGYPLEDIDLQIISISDEPIKLWLGVQKLNTGEVGEIVVSGPNVTQEYLANDEANLKSKIFDTDSGKYWHRTGDLGRLDEGGRVWFYGRKSQRVITKNVTLFTIPCESVINQHPKVSRSALVGVKFQNEHVPVICIESVSGIKRTKKLKKELLDLAASNTLTMEIRVVLFHKKFPVDPRHNAKIFREKLAVWAQKQLQ